MVKISLSWKKMEYLPEYFIFFFAFISLLWIFFITLVEAIKSYSTLPQFLITNLSRIPLHTLIIVFVMMSLVWCSLSFFSKRVITVYLFISLCTNYDKFLKFFEFITRFLSLLPTLILGNVIIISLAKIELPSTNIVVNIVIIVTSLVFIGLPSIIQLMIKVLKDFNIQQLVQDRVLLGVDYERGIKDAIPISSFKASIIVSLGRIFIEGYLALYNTDFIHLPNNAIFNSPTDVSKIFYILYSTATIHSNIYLILILFIMACVANLWALGYISITK